MKTSENASFIRRLMTSFIAVAMMLHISGCSTSSSPEDGAASGGDETFAEESEGDFSNSDGGGDEQVADSSGEAKDGAEAPAEGDLAAEDDLGKEVDGAGGDDMALDGEADALAANDAAADDELSLDDEVDAGLPDDVAKTAEPEPTPAPAAPTDEPVFATNDQPPPTDTVTEPPPAPAPTAFLPVLKIKSAAFDSGGTNLNRVYLARPGDTKQSVAEKLYGDKARSKDLQKWNSFLSRGVKTGDKIYYASPNNPTDQTMLTYYEDVGIAPQTYVSKEGDNIRKVSKELLGNEQSWKEVWATNFDIESKGDIPAGLNIRYWPEGSVAAPVLAKNETIPGTSPGADGMSAPPADMNPPPAPPGGDPLAMNPPAEVPPNPTPGAIDPNQMPPPADPLAANPTATPASDPLAAGTTAAPPSEPPPPPPPPKKANAAPPPMDPMAGGTEEADQMMTMGLAGIVLLAAGAVFFMIRRNKSRKVDLTQTTQVG